MVIHGLICVTSFTPRGPDGKPGFFCALKRRPGLPSVQSFLFLSTNNLVVFTRTIWKPPKTHHNLYNKDNLRTRSLELNHNHAGQC